MSGAVSRIMYHMYHVQGRQTRGGGSQLSLNFGEGSSTPHDFEKKKKFSCSHRPFLIASRRNAEKWTFLLHKNLKVCPFNRFA